MNAITLLELNSRVKQALKNGFPSTLWITAEITELQLNRSGHCYLQLADKREDDDSIVATARATIWSFTFRMLQDDFEKTTGRSLAKGLKVMLNVEIVFHELYGYSLNVKDIDSTYTVGDLERKRREILKRLENDGVIHMNKELEFPSLPKTIAVISSPTAAGFGDFMNQLEHNPYGYAFHVKLFPAVMQGDKTTESVIAALEQIYKFENCFDVVVLIRGGGSQTDLSCFDTYDLAAHVAQFPLPVISGIGHERDETIVDHVAYMRVKTPTAAAAYLVECFAGQDHLLKTRQHDFSMKIRALLNQEHKRQLLTIADFKRSVQRVLPHNLMALRLIIEKIDHCSEMQIQHRLTYFEQLNVRLNKQMAFVIERQTEQLGLLQETFQRKVEQGIKEHVRRLEWAEHTVKLADPRSILERGYSITRCHGKAVKRMGELKPGDLLETEVADGIIKSEVK